jgi:predicted Zn-dependent protease
MKSNKTWLVFTVTLLLTILCASCDTVPITGRSQLNFIPDSTMNQMADDEYKKVLAESKKSTNAEQTAMVQRVGTRIADAVERYCRDNGMAANVAGYKWEFNLLEDKQVNAWAMPGGKVVVYTGILPITKDETGLAVVMAHEVAHAIARHGSERMSQGLVAEMGGMALSEAISSQPAATQSLFMKSYGTAANVGFILPYSRLHESEADRLGLIFMAMAGYNPEAAVDFWQRMASQPGNAQKPPELLSTHPSDQTRIANIKSLLPEAMGYYHPAGQAVNTTSSPALKPIPSTGTTPGQEITTGSKAAPSAGSSLKPVKPAPKKNAQSAGGWNDIVYGSEKTK